MSLDFAKDIFRKCAFYFEQNQIKGKGTRVDIHGHLNDKIMNGLNHSIRLEDYLFQGCSYNYWSNVSALCHTNPTLININIVAILQPKILFFTI